MSPHFFKRHSIILRITWQTIICGCIAFAVVGILRICQVRDIAYSASVAYILVILFYYLRTRKKQPFQPIGRYSWKSFLIIYGFSLIYLGIFSLVCLPVQTLTPVPYVVYACAIRYIFTGWAEELLFREYFVSRMIEQQYKPWTAIIVSSLVFMLFHFPGQWLTAIPYSVLGLALGWYYVKTKDLGISVALHCCWDMHVWLLLRAGVWESAAEENTTPIITALFPQGLSYDHYMMGIVFGWFIFVVSIFFIAKKIGNRYVVQYIK
jgi:Predicted metal-dependent membrane protease